MRPQVGHVINNKYRLLRLVGDGGMGSVYEARHEVLGTSVALKFLHPELTRRPGLVQRFLQEARVSAQVQSPHVVRVTDVDQVGGGGAYIVMEFLEGRTLQTLYEELYRAGQQLSYADALEYAMQMLEGVEAAHKQSVVHRDLKPDNVMITTDTKGRPLLKLLDFGIAKLRASSEYERGLTRPGVIMGTPEYMAPEQAFSADAVDARADIFSLGVMIFEMLAGRRPVGGEEPQQIAAAYLSGRIAQLTDLAPSISPDLGAAVHRAMAALTRDRWQTVTAFRDALEPFAVAAKAPSAMPSGALSNPSISVPPATPIPAAITPPATNVGGDAMADAAPHAVPRTVGPDATNPAEPPVMSAPKIRDATPIGGFALADVPGSAPAYVPPTKSVSPLGAPPADHGSTSFAVPLGDHAPPLDLSPRPSGTAIGEPMWGGPPGDASYGGPPAEPLYGGPPGAPPEGAFIPAPRPPPAYTPGPPVPSRAKPKSRGLSIAGILLLAAGVAGAAVGGAYIAQNQLKTEEKDDPPVAVAPSATVASDPPVDTPPPPQTSPPPSTLGKPPIQIPPRPPPRGTVNPRPGTAPSSQPSSRPPVLPIFPPIVIPSTFPLSFPFPPPDQPREPPRSRPDMPPPRDPPRRQEPPPRRGQNNPDPSYDQALPSEPPPWRPRPQREPSWDQDQDRYYDRYERPYPRPGVMPRGPRRPSPDY